MLIYIYIYLFIYLCAAYNIPMFVCLFHAQVIHSILHLLICFPKDPLYLSLCSLSPYVVYSFLCSKCLTFVCSVLKLWIWHQTVLVSTLLRANIPTCNTEMCSIPEDLKWKLKRHCDFYVQESTEGIWNQEELWRTERVLICSTAFRLFLLVATYERDSSKG